MARHDDRDRNDRWQQRDPRPPQRAEYDEPRQYQDNWAGRPPGYRHDPYAGEWPWRGTQDLYDDPDAMVRRRPFLGQPFAAYGLDRPAWDAPPYREPVWGAPYGDELVRRVDRGTYPGAPRGYEGRYREEGRDFLDKAGDEIASWFGDDDAQRRREADHRGRGPRDYKRPDSRIEEDVNDRLTDDSLVDASDVVVSVSDREVTLDGHVDSRRAKRRAEDCCDSVSGVTHVQNNLRVRDRDTGTATTSQSD